MGSKSHKSRVRMSYLRLVGFIFVFTMFVVGCSPSSNAGEEVSRRLVAACLKGDLPAVTSAVEAGADVNNSSMAGTPLQLAARGGHVQVVRFLLESGADPDANPGLFVGRTPLQEAIMKNRYDVVVALVEGEADVNKKNTNGRTPLDFAALALDDPAIAEFLIEHKAQFSRPENTEVLKSFDGNVRELMRVVTQ